jgi:hypothetical protein
MTKIFATGNEIVKNKASISYYIFEKDESFLNWLGEVLTKILKIEEGTSKAKCISHELTDDAGKITNVEIYAKDIKKMRDIHEHYENKTDRIDCFYGQNRVFVTFRKSEEKRNTLTKFIRETKEWVEVKEKNDMPSYTKNKIQQQENRSIPLT